jgi:hypothetical protein
MVRCGPRLGCERGDPLSIAPVRNHLQHHWVDGGYQGAGMRALAEPRGWTTALVLVPPRGKPPPLSRGFQVLG